MDTKLPPKTRSIKLLQRGGLYHWACSECSWTFPFTDENSKPNSP